MKAVPEYFAGMSTQKRILLGVVGALIALGGSVAMYVVSQDPHQMLYSDLQPEDSKAIAKKLSDQKIPYRISEDGTTISVPSSRVHASRMELAKAGLPGQDVVGFEKFDSSTIGMSSYVQRIQYVRAVQGELTRSIQRLASVKRARVHISIPPKKTFLEEEDPPKASVVLELRTGQTPSKGEINGIAHLVASAVEGLKVRQVTIVDTSGSFLHRPDDHATGMESSTLLEMQRGIETDYEKRVVDLLTPVVGLGKVRAKVTAEIDPSRVNTMEETYDPDKVVVRNAIKNDEVSQGTKPNPVGIPGSRSNLPGTETQNPPMPVANHTTEKNVQNMNYAIPKKIQTIDKPSGNIKRLTVSVIVDGNYSNVPGKTTETFAPRSEEELKRLQDIVKNAVGFDNERRDSITISSLPFKSVDVFPAEEPVSKEFNLQEFSRHALKNSLLALVVIMFFFMVVRPFLKWATVAETEKEYEALPRTVAELEAVRRDEGLMALAKAASNIEETEPLDKKEEEDLTRKIVEKLKATPRKGYRIVQDWMDDETIRAEAA